VAPIVQESAPELPSTAPITAEEAPHPADLPEVPPVQPPTTHEMHDDGQIAQANAAAEVLERVEHVWNDIIRDVRVQDKTLQALLNSGVRPVDVKDNVVWLEVANDWLLKRLEVVTARSIVERVLSKHIGSNYGIRCLVKEQDRENPNQLREQIREARKDPLVKAAINIFDADIIAVERENQGETT
jgi:DNA polymerase-3 subunit gamma/tau